MTSWRMLVFGCGDFQSESTGGGAQLIAVI